MRVSRQASRTFDPPPWGVTVEPHPTDEQTFATVPGVDFGREAEPWVLEPTAKLTGLVFEATEGGPLRQSNFYDRVFQPAAVRAGLAEMVKVEGRKRQKYVGPRFHDLRHTCVALLVAQGAHPLAIKERLGHSSITVTLDTYGHLLPSLNEGLTDGLEETFRRAERDGSRTERGLGRPGPKRSGDPHPPSPAGFRVGLAGFEPTTFGPPDRRANQAAPQPVKEGL